MGIEGGFYPDAPDEEFTSTLVLNSSISRPRADIVEDVPHLRAGLGQASYSERAVALRIKRMQIDLRVKPAGKHPFMSIDEVDGYWTSFRRRDGSVARKESDPGIDAWR